MKKNKGINWWIIGIIAFLSMYYMFIFVRYIHDVDVCLQEIKDAEISNVDYGLNYLVNVSLDSNESIAVDTTYSYEKIDKVSCYLLSKYAIIICDYTPQRDYVSVEKYKYFCVLKSGEWIWINDNLTEKTYRRINSYFQK